jgi:hypothetical protein
VMNWQLTGAKSSIHKRPFLVWVLISAEPKEFADTNLMVRDHE